MKIEQQVASLELCKRLKELHLPQNSHFYWENCPDFKKFIIRDIYNHDIITGEFGDCHLLIHQEHYSAFTVSELGELLPTKIDVDRWLKDLYLRSFKDEDGFRTVYEANYYTALDCEYNLTLDKNEANSRTKMLIYLLENKLMELPKEPENA